MKVGIIRARLGDDRLPRERSDVFHLARWIGAEASVLGLPTHATRWQVQRGEIMLRLLFHCCEIPVGAWDDSENERSEVRR